METPKHLFNDIRKGRISVGTECFPPDEEEMFPVRLIDAYFQKLAGGPQTDFPSMEKELSEDLAKCSQIEGKCASALSELCTRAVLEMMRYPSGSGKDLLKIEAELVSSIDACYGRIVPDATGDFSFDSIEDMEGLSDEIYKRRMLNALIAGAASAVASDPSPWVSEIFQIDPDLPALYKRIMHLNTVLAYAKSNPFDPNASSNGGFVEARIGQDDKAPTIHAEATCFPSLVDELVTGILELAISHGLPKNREKAEYVVKKSDFRLAELWDLRFGLPLWERITETAKNAGLDIMETGLPYFFMEISMMKPMEFNSVMKEFFACTRKGERIMEEILSHIEKMIGQDEFESSMREMESQNAPEEGWYEPEELAGCGEYGCGYGSDPDEIEYVFEF